MSRVHIDLNADVGESFGRWTLGSDADLIAHITSASVACGYHAGDPGVMRATVRLARDAGVSVGAHPGLPDLAGFGRRSMAASAGEVEDFVLYQIGALAAIAAAEGVRIRHVKPHGALYDMASRDRTLAGAVVRAVASFDRSLILFGLPGTELLRAARTAGLGCAVEGFADRTYEPDGSLTPRRRTGAVIHGAEQVVERAIRMVREAVVCATDGSDIPMRVDTICIHGDTPGAHELAGRLRQALEQAGCRVAACGSTDRELRSRRLRKEWPQPVRAAVTRGSGGTPGHFECRQDGDRCPPFAGAWAAGVPMMLRGSKRGLVKKVQPVSIHGQISLDVYFVDPDEPEGQVSLARIGPESVPKHLEAGDQVDLHYTLGVVTQITRPM